MRRSVLWFGLLLVALSALPAAAQPAAPPDPVGPDSAVPQTISQPIVSRQAGSRAVIGLSYGLVPKGTSFSIQDAFTYYYESAVMSGAYTVPSTSGVDAHANVRVFHNFTVGVGITKPAHKKQTVDFTGQMPHPTVYHFYRTWSGPVTAPAREEMGTHLQIGYLVEARRGTLLLFAGPSFYSVKQAVQSDYAASCASTYATNCTVTNVNFVMNSASMKTGFNLGADAAMYFGQLGVGGTLRYGRARATVTEPDSDKVSFDVGGLSVSLGVRVRF